MNTIKTAIVTATLLAVGYGAHVVMNRPLSTSEGADAGVWDSPSIDFPSGLPNHRPSIEFPPLPASESVDEPQNPFAKTSSGKSTESAAVAGDFENMSEPRLLASSMPPATEIAEMPNYGSDTHFASPAGDSASGQSMAAEAPSGLVAVPPLETTNPPQPPQRRLGENSPGSPGEAMPVSFESQVPQVSFDEVWATSQQQIQQGDYANALYRLSQLYNDRNLAGSDRDRLIPLLDQLAGTVIYSQQHLIQPGFVATGGEAVAQVASLYGLPAEFLAHVNGISASQPLTAGQQLKVVRGPFHARLDLQRRELTLFLDNIYAGRFSVSVGRDFPEHVTTLVVTNVLPARPYMDTRTGQQIPAGAD